MAAGSIEDLEESDDELPLDQQPLVFTQGKEFKRASSGAERKQPRGYNGLESAGTNDQVDAQGGLNRERISVSLADSKKCKVCGKTGHVAGFVGATYVDCPNKPCYLCKQPGHTTATCPHRLQPGFADEGSSSKQSSGGSLADVVYRRQEGHRDAHVARHPKLTWHLEAGVLGLHQRRITCLAFMESHPHVLLSGDKGGQLGVWHVTDPCTYKVHVDMNKWHTSTIKSIDGALTGFRTVCCASDGTVKVFDPESGASQQLLNINPQGWSNADLDSKSWGMLIGLAVPRGGSSTIYTGDSLGKVYAGNGLRRGTQPPSTQQGII